MKKDIARAAAVDNTIHMAGLQKVLTNIGLSEHRITSSELQSIFEELGQDGSIEAPVFVKMI
jgi:hypothetical protein